MSVIFKTLKKLKTESTEKENSKIKLVRKKRIYFFNNAFYSPSYVFLLLFILTVVGAGTLYGYYHLRETTDENTKGFAVPNTNVENLTNVDTAEGSENKESENKNEPKDSASSRIEYIAPETNDRDVEVYHSDKSANAEVPFSTEEKTPPKFNETNKKNVVAKAKSEKSVQPSAAEISPVSEVEKIFLANAKKNEKIARLVADIHWEMGSDNKKQVEKYLDELALLKGQNNSYVLKLKAAWHIHNKEFEQAKDLLKIVLTKNEFDQEAGINMAIIEINTKEMDNAYQRLSKLQKVYPENVRITEILQDLKHYFKNVQKYNLSRDKKS